MAIKRRVLGRGLEALLGAVRGNRGLDHDHGTLDYGNNEGVAAVTPSPPPQAAVNLPIELIDRGRQQPRQNFSPESLQDLANSISIQGVLQPILVRPVEHGRYEIVAGERRWRASQMVGLTEIPAVVRVVDASSALAIGFIENSQRDSLTPLEEARALSRLINEFGLTHQALAEAIGKSRTTVTNLLRLLDLEPETSQYLETNQLEAGHARVLLSLKGEQQCQAACYVVAGSLSVRESEKLVRRLQLQASTVAAPSPHSIPNQPYDPHVCRLQDDLAKRLGARVDIRHRNSGKGKLVIIYNNLAELDSILAHIK